MDFRLRNRTIREADARDAFSFPPAPSAIDFSEPRNFADCSAGGDLSASVTPPRISKCKPFLHQARSVGYNLLMLPRPGRFGRAIASLVLLVPALALAATATPLRHRTSRTSRASRLVIPAGPLDTVLPKVALASPARSKGLSIEVAELDTGKVVFEKNPQQPETIASVTKLFTTAAALHLLRDRLQVQDDPLAAWRSPGRPVVRVASSRGRRRSQHLRPLLQRRLQLRLRPLRADGLKQAGIDARRRRHHLKRLLFRLRLA